MTEEQIERAVERRIDALDTRYIMNNPMITQEEYEAALQAIYDWGDAERARVAA